MFDQGVAERPERISDLEYQMDAGPLVRDIGQALRGLRFPELHMLLLAAVLMGVPLWLLEDTDAARQWLFAGTVIGLIVTGLCWSGPVRGRFGWLLPALLRAIEYSYVLLLIYRLAPDLLPVAYGYLVVVAFHHYDIAYRLRHTGRAPARWVYTAGLGYDGRLLIIASLTLAGVGALRTGLWILTVSLAVVFVLEAAVGWMRWLRAENAAAAQRAELA